MKRVSEKFEDRACCNKGKEIMIEQTGDDECNAYDTTYQCGGTWHNNFMDIVGLGLTPTSFMNNLILVNPVKTLLFLIYFKKILYVKLVVRIPKLFIILPRYFAYSFAII